MLHFLMLPLVVSQATGQLSDDQRVLAEAAHVGCMNNIHAFEHVTCDFRVTKGSAVNMEGALTGQLHSPIVTTGRWIRRKQCDRFVLRTDDVTKARLAKGPSPHPTLKGVSFVQMETVGLDWLNTGEIDVKLVTDSGEAHLLPQGYGDERGCREHPVSVLIDIPPAFGWRMNKYREGICTIAAATYSSRESRRVIDVIFGGDRDQTVEVTIDPELGYLPVRTTLKTPQRVEMVVAVTDTRECSGGRVFPTQVSLISVPKRSGDSFIVTRYDVISLDADRIPSDEDLSVVLPAGTVVVQRPDQSKFMRIRKEEKVGPGDVKKLWAMTDQATKRPLADTAIPRESRWTAAAWGLSALAVVGGLYAIYARKRRLA